MSFVSGFTEQERNRYSKLNVVPKDEWTADDVDLFTRWKIAEGLEDAAYKEAQAEQRAALEKEVQITKEIADEARETLKALKARALSRYKDAAEAAGIG